MSRDINFNPDDPDTWPVVLTLPEVAEILNMGEVEIVLALWAGTFEPRPLAELYPDHLRWRKVDLLDRDE